MTSIARWSFPKAISNQYRIWMNGISLWCHLNKAFSVLPIAISNWKWLLLVSSILQRVKSHIESMPPCLSRMGYETQCVWQCAFGGRRKIEAYLTFSIRSQFTMLSSLSWFEKFKLGYIGYFIPLKFQSPVSGCTRAKFDWSPTHRSSWNSMLHYFNWSQVAFPHGLEIEENLNKSGVVFVEVIRYVFLVSPITLVTFLVLSKCLFHCILAS